MEDIQHAFPNFVPNQVLSSGQLNDLRDYLDQQDRLSRIRLSGTGIVCGLSIERTASAGPLRVSEGFGISSDGYLIGLPAGQYSHWRDYRDPGNDEDGKPSYLPWRQRPGLDTQIELLQLLEGQEDAATDKPLTAAKLNGRVAVLYLQLSEQDLRTCLVTDCNNKGSNVRLLPRLLLVKQEDLSKLNGCDPAPLPVEVPRLHSGMAFTETKTTSQLNGGYAEIVEKTMPVLVAAIKDAFDRYGKALGLNTDGADAVKNFEAVIKKALDGGKIDQYHYDLVVDMATAHREFIAAACRWIPDCSMPDGHPRHLMLEHLQGINGYRHLFRAAPMHSHSHGGYEQTAQLMRRLLAMLGAIAMDPPGDVRISPSHGEDRPLGASAVPYYCKLDDKQLNYWRPDDCCTPAVPWGYRGAADALNRDYRRCSLLRIEGHLGRNWVDGQREIAQLRRQYNAEFDLLVLYLGGPGVREKKAFEDLGKERVKREKAEAALAVFVGKAVEADRFQPDGFATAYRDKAETIRVLDERVSERKAEWLRVRMERKLLCNIGHLEADYGTVRAELQCVFHRLRTALDAISMSRIPPIEDIDEAARKRGIKEAAASYESLSEAIKTETNAVKLKKLQNDRVAAEAKKITLEAEASLFISARKSAPAAMAAVAESGELDKVTMRAVETLERVRGDNVANTVQLAEQVSVEGLRVILQRLMDLLPQSLTAFDLPAFMLAFKQLIADLIALRLMTLVKLMISVTRGHLTQSSAAEKAALLTLANSLRIEEQDMQHMLLAVLHDCRHSRLVYLYHLYLYHRQNDDSRFADFASRHPGMEHLAGVEKGGTFILVAEDEAPAAVIVADFALYGDAACCCEPPDELCLPPVAMPDYRIVRLRLAKAGDAYLPVELFVDVLANDYDPNQAGGKFDGSLRQIELLQEQSELGAELRLDKLTGLVEYRLEHAVAGAVDRFSYRLRATGTGCSGEDSAQVLILLVPEVKPEPELGAIAGRVTWHKQPVADALVRVRDSERVATTDKTGSYRIDNLAPGSYALHAELWGGEVISDPLTAAVVAGETAAGIFDLPKDQQEKVGNLHLRVFDSSNRVAIKDATAVLIDGRDQMVARVEAPDADALYRLNGVPAGSYKLAVAAPGYFPDITEDLAVRAGTTDTRNVALIVQGVYVPGAAVGFVAVNDGVRDDDARLKIAKAYADRQSTYIKAMDDAAGDPSVRNSEAYAKADEFLTKTVQDPSLREEEVIARYDEVSKSLASSVNRAGDARKDDYRALLSNVSKAFMDRVSLENPEAVKPKTEEALIEMNANLTGAGIDMEAVRTEWKGDELSTDLGLKSSERIRVVIAR
jgi:hypothetical protein